MNYLYLKSYYITYSFDKKSTYYTIIVSLKGGDTSIWQSICGKA